MSDQNSMEGINTDLWQFPCRIGFKAMAENRDQIDCDIVSAIQQVVPGDYSPTIKPSKKGTYVSVTVTIHFANKDQVESVYRAVRLISGVKMCL